MNNPSTANPANPAITALANTPRISIGTLIFCGRRRSVLARRVR
ncbi:MAG: hypothetical protein ACRDSZ_10160 [Pseudonocardiaceae bacterium]